MTNLSASHAGTAAMPELVRTLRVAIAVASLLTMFSAGLAIAAKSASALDIGLAPAPPPYAKADGGLLEEIGAEIARRLGEQATFGPADPDAPLDADGRFDLALAWPQRHEADLHYAPAFAFAYVAASPRAGGLRIRRVEDLIDRRIVAFRDAATVLMEPFRTVRARALMEGAHYLELDDPAEQAAMLLSGRAEVAVMERRVAAHFARGEPVDFHPVFPAQTTIWAITRDPDRAEAVADALEAMRADGWFETLEARYAPLETFSPRGGDGWMGPRRSGL